MPDLVANLLDTCPSMCYHPFSVYRGLHAACHKPPIVKYTLHVIPKPSIHPVVEIMLKRNICVQHKWCSVLTHINIKAVIKKGMKLFCIVIIYILKPIWTYELNFQIFDFIFFNCLKHCGNIFSRCLINIGFICCYNIKNPNIWQYVDCDSKTVIPSNKISVEISG